MNTLARRWLTAPLVGTAIAVLAAGAASVSVPQLVPKASAYFLGNGCDEYDPARSLTYRCVPDRTTFYTPDGVDPNRVPVGAGYPGETSVFASVTVDGGGFPIPPPAPYRPGRDYCSNPWYGNSSFEGKWQFTCYRHDVCYGSQWGRKFCDVRFWHNMVADCKSFSWYNPDRYACFVDARIWYYAARWFGASHYRPRTSSDEPKGE